MIPPLTRRFCPVIHRASSLAALDSPDRATHRPSSDDPAIDPEILSGDPSGVVAGQKCHRGSKSLPLLQVFHDGLLFLTFLPGSARRSATRDHGSDPRLGHRCCDFLESSGATWLNVGGSGSTAGNSRNPWFFLETQLAASGGWVFHDRLESKESFRSSDRRTRFQPHKPS